MHKTDSKREQFDTPARVLEEIRTLYSDPDPDLSTRLIRELIVHALKCRRDDLEVLDLKVLSRAMAEFRYAARTFMPYRDRRKVSIFGSARTPEDDPYYKMAVEFAHMLAEEGFMVITGAAEGIMKAGNVGAGKDASFGVNILLPFEQAPNPVIGDDPKLITFKYFFTRKLFFVMEASAVALFPGGFGTHDEGFETMTLIQTGKAPPMPLLFVELPGGTYWSSFDQFVRDQLLGRKLISQRDLVLYKIVHSPREAVDYIKFFYSTYHSLRFVRDRVVLRLEKELPDDAVHELAHEFSDLVKKGTVEKSNALPEETNEPELLDKHRLVFALNRQSPARLYEMVLKINELGAQKR
ncbi:MAG TPA: LOG family protein [Candidatus Krumholzibacteria bacterium]|nr:LOG family protein [Candidatus Krumholzibacteria bacterium]